MNRTPHVQLHLPPLSPDQALFCIDILERLINAIWRTHGDEIDLWLAAVHCDAPPSPPPPIAAPAPSDDDDLPF